MSEANEADGTTATPNSRYVQTDEDRRRDGLYQATSIHGQCGDPNRVIESARLIAAFLKDG